MTSPPELLRPCLSDYLGYACQLEAGHHGDHMHTFEHANAIHTTVWTDSIDELAQRRGRR